MNALIKLLTATLLIAMFSTCFTGISWADSYWNLKTIDEDANAPGFIVLDSENNPHILYHPDTGGFSSYAGPYSTWNIYISYGGWAWTSQKLNFDGMIAGIALALDSYDNPHVLCYGLINQELDELFNGTLELLYASWTGTNWTLQTVDRYYNVSMYSLPLVLGALVFDSEGNPHIAYTVNTSEGVGENELKYAVSTVAGWDVQTIDNNVDDSGLRFSPHGISLGVDLTGNSHVMYTKSDQITYAVSTLQGWNKQVIVNNATFGNMVLDSQGNPHFIFLSSNSSLIYSEWNGSAWNTQSVAPDADSGYLALDSQDQPHMDYLTNGNLTYASFENGTWSAQIIDYNDYQAGPLVMDSNGNPHVSYGGMSCLYGRSYQMYATTTLVAAPTVEPSTPNFQLNLWGFIIIIAAGILLAIAVVVYDWGKKPRK